MTVPPDQWAPRARPTAERMAGRWIDVVPWSSRLHADDLWEEFGGPATNERLHHFGWHPMESARDLGTILDRFNAAGEFVTCVFALPENGRAVAMASYMSFSEAHGRVETGAIATGASIARTPAASEGHYLMARRVFDELGYRRYEWKLNDPNAASHAAAQRMGFAFEGVFRQHQIMPYGNRDTAWYSMLDREWPARRAAFEAWLDPANFDEEGRQKERLRDLVELFAGESPATPPERSGR